MQPSAHSLSLLPQQTRLINATEGLRLEVHSGCLWLTRPGDAVDRFLVAGDSIELHANGVLIQSDRHPVSNGLQAARYALVPLRPVGQRLRDFQMLCWAGLRGVLARGEKRSAARLASS